MIGGLPADRNDQLASLGQLVQIDHSRVYPLPGVQFKEFKAICPLSKQLVVRCYSRANARNATRFLQVPLQQMTFPVTSIQVAGGSEFMAEFETACQNLGLPLYVLPPRRPQYNGCVQRAHSTTRCEFWTFYLGELRVADINRALQQHLHFYHHRRPHRSLGFPRPLDTSGFPCHPFLRCLKIPHVLDPDSPLTRIEQTATMRPVIVLRVSACLSRGHLLNTTADGGRCGIATGAGRISRVFNTLRRGDCNGPASFCVAPIG